MRRPSRSFTVEVKRSRLRTGDPSIASAISEREELPPASVSSSMSWDELLRRLPENVASQSDQPFISSWPGLEEEQPALNQPQPQVEQKSEAVSESELQAESKKSRVLPSLLPVEMPLTERKSAIFSEDSTPWPSTRSRLPKQPRAHTTELRAAVTQNKPRRAYIGDGAKVTVEALKKLVENHLQDRTVGTVKATVRPAQTSALASSGQVAARATEVGVSREILPRNPVKRRRQDFWKHRLRSYAAK